MSNNQNNFSDFFKNFPIFGILIPVFSCIMFFTGWSGYTFYYDQLILKGQWWRLLIYYISVMRLINLFFQIMMCIFFSHYYEKKIGSIRFIYEIFIYSLIIGILNLPLSIYLTRKFSFFVGIEDSIGIYVFFKITVKCFKNPHSSSVSMCCPFPIKNIYFPFVIILMNFLMSNGLMSVSDITVILFSLLYIKYEKIFKNLILKSKYVNIIEKRMDFLNRIGTVYYIFDDPDSLLSKEKINTLNDIKEENKKNTYIKEIKDHNLEKVIYSGKGVTLNKNSNKNITKEERRKKILEYLEKKGFIKNPIEEVKAEEEDDVKEVKELNIEKIEDNRLIDEYDI